MWVLSIAAAGKILPWSVALKTLHVRLIHAERLYMPSVMPSIEGNCKAVSNERRAQGRLRWGEDLYPRRGTGLAWREVDTCRIEGF